MRKKEVLEINSSNVQRRSGEEGTALVIALLVLALISVFVAFAMSRTAAEAAAVGNETAEARTMYAAQGSLETMTRNFNKVFEQKLNPSAADLARVRDGDIVPGLSRAQGGQFDFVPELDKISDSTATVLSGGPYSGLYAIRDTWRLRTTATDSDGTQIMLTRNILNNRVPIFQFGIFYDDDLELFRPPRFSFGGRVHSNRHFFISPGTEGVYFDSRVTAAGHIITQTWRNGNTSDMANNKTYIKNASGVDKQLTPTMGSVLNGTPNVFASGRWANPDMPESKLNSSFETQTAIFDGNLLAGTKSLKLPLKVGNDNADLVEMLRRGKEVATSGSGDLAWNGTAVVPVTPATSPLTTATVDNDIQRSERFANKTGIRVSLSDSKQKLPGCADALGAAVTTPCGIRLDGDQGGALEVTRSASAAGARGYQPLAMLGTDGYATTRVNGERLFTGGGRETWIKIETVRTDDVTGAVVTADITADILSLGVTEEYPADLATAIGEPSGFAGSRAGSNNGTPTVPSSNLTAATAQTPLTYPDSRSIVKIQRYAIPGADFPKTAGTAYASYNAAGTGFNFVRRFTAADATKIAAGCQVAPATTPCVVSNDRPPLSTTGLPTNVNSWENFGHLKYVRRGTSTAAADNIAVVPFPIQMFDSREGEYYDDAARYTSGRVTRNGVMSLIDIDVANLRRFLRGDFDGRFPVTTPFAIANGGNGLRQSNIPQREGWVLYVSDRRGDADFDGEYDGEDIYSASPGNTGGLDLGEDVNRNGVLDAKYIQPASDVCVLGSLCEATKYAEDWLPDYAAVLEHKYYRRGVRLINGTTLPGVLDLTVAGNTRGFTVSSENGVYVKGNYNATGVTSVPSTGNTPFNNYRPLDTATHIPASIVADGITILSNNWKDAESFTSPYDKNGSYRQATETTIRFAMISGDTIASKEATPNQGGISPRLNGGVHNFKRFLEKWTGEYLNYSGSLINLFNSRNNMGSFKCCNTVYDPPYRNWVFDNTFLDPTRIPPGTPFFQYVQTTGFERSTE